MSSAIAVKELWGGRVVIEKQEVSQSFIKTESNSSNTETERNTYEQNGKHGIGHISGGEIKDGAKIAGVLNEATDIIETQIHIANSVVVGIINSINPKKLKSTVFLTTFIATLLLVTSLPFLFNLFLLNNTTNFYLGKTFPSLSQHWLTYTDTTHGIKIKYPKTWNYELKQWDTFINFYPLNDKKSEAKIAIAVEPLSELITLEKYKKLFKNQVSMNNEEVKFIAQEETWLLHNNAYKILYRFKSDNKKTEKMAIMTLINKKCYILYYEAEINSFQKFKPLAVAMADLLEFTNP